MLQMPKELRNAAIRLQGAANSGKAKRWACFYFCFSTNEAGMLQILKDLNKYVGD